MVDAVGEGHAAELLCYTVHAAPMWGGRVTVMNERASDFTDPTKISCSWTVVVCTVLPVYVR